MNGSEDFIILTCALITHRMIETFNVTTVEVGGFKDIPLFYASFPDSQVFKFENLINALNLIELWQNETLPKDLIDLIPSPFMIGI